jgi:N-acetylglucosaminyldiphosphoundecaprenol N-acetyl-beta-D-mannosaminyltransferase
MVEEKHILVSARETPSSGSRFSKAFREVAPRVSVGAVAIDTYSQDMLVLEAIDHALHGAGTRQIITVNAQFYVLAQRSDKFRECLRVADYVCADGMPVVWACHFFTKRYIPRITGVDLIDKLCQRGAAHKLRVFFLGGRPDAANETGRILSERYPGLEIAGASCPPWGFQLNPETLQPVLDQIAQSNAHLLFVGLGCPKQELLIHDHIRSLKVPLAIGIGGGFEIFSGLFDRAPKWMQHCGLEWAFRLYQEPRRLWKRYLFGNLEFLWFLVTWRLRERLQINSTSSCIPDHLRPAPPSATPTEMQ